MKQLLAWCYNRDNRGFVAWINSKEETIGKNWRNLGTRSDLAVQKGVTFCDNSVPIQVAPDKTDAMSPGVSDDTLTWRMRTWQLLSWEHRGSTLSHTSVWVTTWSVSQNLHLVEFPSGIFPSSLPTLLLLREFYLKNNNKKTPQTIKQKNFVVSSGCSLFKIIPINMFFVQEKERQRVGIFLFYTLFL